MNTFKNSAKSGFLKINRPRWVAARRVLALLVLVSARLPAAPPAFAQQTTADAPPDAIIEKWDQNWTLNADGSSVYHETRHVRFNSDRAIGEFADPRLAYNKETDTLEVLVARTKLPNGKYLDVPPYSRNEVAPGGTAWPAFAGVRQLVLTMSGIEPGCVVELEYKITTKPGARAFLAGEARLDHRYPILARSVAFTVPKNLSPQIALSDGGAALPIDQKSEPDASGKLVRMSWTLRNVPAAVEEPQARPWQLRGLRWAFTTAASPPEWLADRLGRIEAAAKDSALVADLAARWTKQINEPAEKLRQIQQKLVATFNFTDIDAAWRPDTPRGAADVLQGNYGTPEETAGVLLALARAAGVPLQPALSVSGASETLAPPTLWGMEYVLLADFDGRREIWHPQHGLISRDGRWNDRTIWSLAGGKINRVELPAWTGADESACHLRGKIAFGADGKYQGKLSLHVTGLFVSNEALRKPDGQKARVEQLVRRALPDANVPKFTVTTLSPGVFDVEAEVQASKPAGKIDNCWMLSLAQDGPGLSEVPLPLAQTKRTTSVRANGAFDERIELTIEWPAGWTVAAKPAEIAAVAGAWGKAEQRVTLAERSLTVARNVRLAQRDVESAQFAALRGPLNELRADRARMLLLKP